MRHFIIIATMISLMAGTTTACVKKDAKCKKEHKQARKKGTTGWKY